VGKDFHEEVEGKGLHVADAGVENDLHDEVEGKGLHVAGAGVGTEVYRREKDLVEGLPSDGGLRGVHGPVHGSDVC
jgi:hypothetical protein